MTHRRRAARSSFDKAFNEYNEIRPGYPDELIEDVIHVSAIPEDGRILEVGCGTGQATISFAMKGYSMLCLDIGKKLTGIAREKFENYPNVRISNTSFERWRLIEDAFDILISATAFHWIPPEIGYPKAARALKKTGYIALFWNTHPSPYTGFFEDVQRIYDKIMPKSGDSKVSPTTKIVLEQEVYIKKMGLFEEVEVRKYPWSMVYGTDQYLKLLDTYSDHRALADHRRAQLHTEIRNLIEKKYGGRVTRPYLSVLLIARKRT